MSPGSQHVIDVQQFSFTRDESDEYRGQRSVPGESPAWFESIEFLPFGELIGGQFPQQLIDVSPSALGCESVGCPSPLTALKFFGLG